MDSGLFRSCFRLFRPDHGLFAQHAHNALGRTFTHGASQFNFLHVATRQLIEAFDNDRKTDGRIQIALGHGKTETFGHQRKTDGKQKTQTQHDNGRMRIDETGQWLGSEQHDTHGDNNGQHHDR